MSLTTDRNDPALRRHRADGQQEAYLILSDEERAKGFVRPVRTKYRHIGQHPRYKTRPLTAEENERYNGSGYVLFEEYPPEKEGRVGRYWTQQQLDEGCGTTTTMGLSLSETYAANPKFYTGTFCCACGKHFDLGSPDNPAFLWEPDGDPVGSTNEEAEKYFAEQRRLEGIKHVGEGI